MNERTAGVRAPELLWFVGAASAIAACLSVAWAVQLSPLGLLLCSAVGAAAAVAALWASRARRRASVVKIWLVMGTIGAACFLLYWYSFWGADHYFLTQALGYVLGGSLGLTWWSLQRMRRREV